MTDREMYEALKAEIIKLKDNPYFTRAIKDVGIINTLEVKDVDLEKESAMSNFKSLLHLNGDMKSTCKDWGYAPNLYYFDGSWHVDWISCEEGDSIHGFTAETPEEAIDKAYNWFHSTFCNS